MPSARDHGTTHSGSVRDREQRKELLRSIACLLSFVVDVDEPVSLRCPKQIVPIAVFASLLLHVIVCFISFSLHWLVLLCVSLYCM